MWVMGLKLSSQQRQQLLDWAHEAGELECCGLLLGDASDIQRIERTANVSESPQCRFEIDPAALISAEKQARQGGMKILGYFHSHPNGRASPSPDDAACAVADGRYWFIVANNQISTWRPIAGSDDQPVTFVAEGFV
jgi:desampylase